MRIVDIQLHRVEQVVDLLKLRRFTVQHVPVTPANNDLAADGDLVAGFEPHRRTTRCLVLVVEHDCHARFRDASLTLLVDKLGQVSRPHLWTHVSDG